MMKIIKPQSSEDFAKYYDLRWRILRKPLGQPKGSEKDHLENKSIHFMIIEDSQLFGVARAHFNSNIEAQIRYMAIEEQMQGKGIGKRLITDIETHLKNKKAQKIILYARENAIEFYNKQGYQLIEKAHTLYGSIPHFIMQKNL